MLFRTRSLFYFLCCSFKTKEDSTKNGICGRLKTIDLPISNLEEATTILKRKLSDQISLEFNSRSDIKPPGTPQLPQQSLPLLQFKRETISTKSNGTNGVGLEYNHADGSFMRKTSLYGAILRHGVKSTAYCSTWFWRPRIVSLFS